jgi:hypothetical protein
MLAYYQPYLNRLIALLEGRMADLVADDEGQAETTEMLIRITLAVAIIVVVGGLLYVAITTLGQRTASDIGGVTWGG